jgi:beta-glucosidase
VEVDKLRDAYLKKTRENWKKLTDRLKDLAVTVTTKDRISYKIKLFLG